MARENVVIGLLGTTLDRGGKKRWGRWRPTVDLCRHDDLLIDRFELLHPPNATRLVDEVCRDIESVSPETEVVRHPLPLEDPWDFEEVYASLHDFARRYRFRTERERYLVHVTTGTHVAQICLFLLTESHHFPGGLIQSSPTPGQSAEPGTYRIIELDLSKYDRIAQRFAVEKAESVSFLKSGIATCNPAFNALIDQIETVSLATTAPMLLTGPTGAGKSKLAKRIYALKQSRGRIEGAFVELNCATLRGDAAMSALFGHRRGAFTGASDDRAGLMRAADGGMLFLDEIGELGLDEQAMLLRALEEKTFLPLGSDEEVQSDFQLLAGTNRDLAGAVEEGRFREDLLVRIDLWAFELPGLAQRSEDIEPNLDFELDRYAERTGVRTTLNRQARARFLAFARSPEALWPGSFRDFNAAVERMCTLAKAGRVGTKDVDAELDRLRTRWSRRGVKPAHDDTLTEVLGSAGVDELDLFDRVQLAEVLRVCRSSRSLSEAGRALFSVSRAKKARPNDADRLRKYLARFGLSWAELRA